MTGELSPTLRAVSDAVLAVAAERSVEEVLQRLVDNARELAGARRVHRGGPGADRAARRARRDRDHERAPLRAGPRAVRPVGAQPARARAARRDQPEALQPRAHGRGRRDADRPRPGRGRRAGREAEAALPAGARGAALADLRAAPAGSRARRSL